MRAVVWRRAAAVALGSLGASLAAACARTAPASRPGPAPLPALSLRDFGRFVDTMVTAPAFRNANWGILIVDPAASDTLYSRNAGKLFMPASNQKLLTGATALAQLGASYRFTTRFASTGPMDSVMRGDLVVFGTGDPTFSDTLQGGDYRNAFRAMADSIATRGIRRIAGALVRGGPAFTDAQCGYGWELDDLDEPYAACVDELFVNEGYQRVRRVRRNGDSATVAAAIRDPRGAFFSALSEALAERGIAVAGGTDTLRVVADSGLAPVFTLRSVELPAILARMLKPSQNQVAELLFKTLGRERTGVGTADSARRVVERQLVAWGADTAGFAVRDGSGMSRHDYVTPETIIRVLDEMRRAPTFPLWYAAMPVAGVDGTLENRMRGTAAAGNVRAKTGTVDKARSLSGYVTAADGRMLEFSFLCNNFTVPNREVERVQDAILATIAARARPRR
ncbi:MAG: D-alanyl-D-alanine carboxypeptidase/D-alanyl-D-alanine-endopeptidase [Gemmatimonadaceae bacterium]|nr:D-alanyl-D-alanine carboxypeptidase/D-alanyl-D-alanine-endopeptidase [Gemmatimonadaceae bacterium]